MAIYIATKLPNASRGSKEIAMRRALAEEISLLAIEVNANSTVILPEK